MILIGNSFPLSLIRRKIFIEPVPLDDLRQAIEDSDGIVSFWGHSNTLPAAEEAIGQSLAPATERPVLSLSPEGLPSLNQQIFNECWVLSPDYTENFRPKVGEDVSPEKILGWQVLRMDWNS